MSNFKIEFNGQRGSGGGGFLGGIGCLMVGVLFLVATFYVLKGLFWVLLWASPVLVIAALAVNWRFVAGAVRNFFTSLGRDPLGGLFKAGLMVLAFPFVALFLFLGALGSKRVEAFRQQFEQGVGGGFFSDENPRTTPKEAEYVDFEEIESKPKTGKNPGASAEPEPMEPLELPEKQTTKKKPGNPYDELFQ